LQTLDNFYALRNAVRSAGINLSITGGNKTIRGLAKLLGFAVDKEGGGDDDDDRAREMFGNAPTMASPSAPPTGGERNNTPFGMPDGFFVAGQQGGGAGGVVWRLQRSRATINHLLCRLAPRTFSMKFRISIRAYRLRRSNHLRPVGAISTEGLLVTIRS